MARALAASFLVAAGFFALAGTMAASSCTGADPAPVAPAADAAPSTKLAPRSQPVDTWELATKIQGTHWSLEQRREAVAAGMAVMQREQCTRCHEIDGMAGTGRPYDCVSCHIFLKGLVPGERRYEDIARNNGRDVLERYQRNIRHFMAVPRLTGVARRVRPDWIASYLAAPFDVRPALEESMIRNRLGEGDIRTVVRYFAAMADVEDPYAPGWQAPAPPAPPDATRIAEGRQRFVQWGCAGCHTFGNEQLMPGLTAAHYATLPGAALAPNLRFARARLSPEVMVELILEPTKIIPGTLMPRVGLPRADAELIRDFLLHAPVEIAAAAPAAPLLEMPPALTRDVGWAEVKERVIGKVCVHCHMNDHEKDIGAGNGGGLGYPGKGLALRTYEMSMRGSLAADGQRYSVFMPLPGEPWPRILQVLIDRRVENQRDHLAPFDDRERPAFGDHPPGMPLGLPALTDEEIGLLRRWIDLGCPGPKEVTGKPSFTDGLLVPDGPIRRNRGCAARAPQEPPPKWATRPPAPPAATPGTKPGGQPRAAPPR